MPSTEHDTSKRNGNDGTYVEITTVRTCQKIFGHKICTPKVKESAHVHLGPEPAKRLAEGVSQAAAAIAATLASTGVGVAAAPWVALAGALVVIGYNALKNNDGSIEIYIDNIHASAGSAHLPVAVDPGTCTAILQAL
jgi:hypothetical protein